MTSRVTDNRPNGPPEIHNPCLNCGAALSGRFCTHCGQPADVHLPSTSELIHEALEGMTHSDSRLWRTLKLLWFKPGKLTQEFVAGRRAAYLPPIRLYLVLSVIFFLVASLSHTHGCEAAVRDSGTGLMHVAAATMPKAMFVFLPLLAFLHKLMYWRPRYRYAEHLLFFLHVHAFFFSLMTLVVLCAIAGSTWPGSGKVWSFAPLLLWCLPLYTFAPMRQVFGGTWSGTLFKASALFAVYLVVLSITLAGVFVYAVLQL
jgi:hypothetical protein